MSVEFCDTNVLVYAFDASAGNKRVQAQHLLERLTRAEEGAISVQVLQELFTTLTRKLRPPLSLPDARSIVVLFTSWRVFEPNSRHVVEAIDFSIRWNLSFWDAMILVAAEKANAEIV